MTKSIENADFNARMNSLRRSVGKARAAAIAGIMVDLRDSGVMRRWAVKIAFSHGFRNRDDIDDDITQVVAEKLLVTISAVEPSTPEPSDWLKYLYGHARNAVADYLASSQVSAAGRMSGANRRQRLIARAQRELLSTLGREATRAEIIAHSNAWAIAHHRDAQKQGLLLSADDFNGGTKAPLSLSSDDITSFGAGVQVVAPSDTRPELHIAMRKLGEIAEQLYPGDTDLLAVLNAWATLTSDGERLTRPALSRLTGLSEEAVKNGLAHTHHVLTEFRDYMRFREESQRN